MSTQQREVLVFVPRRLRRVCAASAVVVVAVFAVLAVNLHGTSGGVAFGLADQIAVFVLGLLVAGGVLLIARPRLRADERGLVIRNIVGSYEIPWSAVLAVHFYRGDSWPSIELPQDETVALMAVQSADGPAADEAVAALRRLHAAAQEPPEAHPAGRDAPAEDPAGRDAPADDPAGQDAPAEDPAGPSAPPT